MQTMKDYEEWHNEALAHKVVDRLRRNEFDAFYFGTSGEASSWIRQQLKPGITVGFGGSATIRAMGIREMASEAGILIADHGKPGLNFEEKMTEMRRELLSDIFISSANAITLNGEIVNVDGYGNRVAAMIFGPRQVIIVAGINKIVSSEAEAMERLKRKAGPMNMKRLERKTPCTGDGYCHDCDSPDRGCRAYTILRKRPALTPTTVILVGEPLGM